MLPLLQNLLIHQGVAVKTKDYLGRTAMQVIDVAAAAGGGHAQGDLQPCCWTQTTSVLHVYLNNTAMISF